MSVTDQTEGRSTKLEIAHVLFMDIVGYSKLPLDHQEAVLRTLQAVVSATPDFLQAQANQGIIRLPTGDGMALAFFGDAEAAARCALEITKALKSHPEIPLRMGLHSGPVYRVADINANQNVAGGGINIAQRVMDCGDAGHILASQNVADVLGHLSSWKDYLHDSGEAEVKHGVRVHLYNVYTDEVGNAELPQKLQTAQRRMAAIRSEARRKKLYWVSAVVVLFLAMAAVGIWYWRTGSGTSQIESIAVIPFASVDGNADADYLSDGLTESLIASLARVPQLKVKSRNSVFRYKGKEVDLQKVGKELIVDALLTGRVVQRGDTVQVNSDLTNVQDNTEIWGEHYERKTSEIIPLEQQIAGDIAGKLRSKLSGIEKQQVAKQGTQNPEAYQLYVKGRHYWNKRTAADIKAAISYFNQAIDKDPGYALAYTGLADAYSVLSVYGSDPDDVIPKANAAAEKALELDPTLARPHAVLGANKFGYSWDFAGGEAELRRALEIDPSDATAHQWFSENLAYVGGRPQEAIDEANRARQLDPLSPIIGVVQGIAYFSARQFGKAIEICNKLIADNPTFSPAHLWLANSYWGEHRYPQAIQEWKTASQLSGNRNDAEFAIALDVGFRSGGWPSALRKGIEASLGQRKARTGYVYPYDIAKLYADLGDMDHAFEWLNTAYQEHGTGLIGLRTDFMFDSLRSDPRYAELVRKIGFPQ
jgi:TolB-like protein/tetratricopeptide (TPR) repeat protein/class 3 adenylate cyclase